jgi:hypothetical protein
MAAIFFVLFGVIVLLNTLVVDRSLAQLKPTLQAFQAIVIVMAAVPVVAAIAAQRAYKLRASLV